MVTYFFCCLLRRRKMREGDVVQFINGGYYGCIEEVGNNNIFLIKVPIPDNDPLYICADESKIKRVGITFK